MKILRYQLPRQLRNHLTYSTTVTMFTRLTTLAVPCDHVSLTGAIKMHMLLILLLGLNLALPKTKI